MFGRKKTALKKLKQNKQQCSACGLTHSGDLVAHASDCWAEAREYQSNADLRIDGTFLSEDFGVYEGEHFFVLCVLYIPVHGLETLFGIGCWSTLSRTNFLNYVDQFAEEEMTDSGPWDGWFQNTLLPYPDSVNIGCHVHPQPDGSPIIELIDQCHR